MRIVSKECMGCLVVLALLAVPARAAVVYGPDTFDTDTNGWTAWTGFTSSWARADIGGGDMAMTKSGTSTKACSIKQVLLPQRMTLDVDLKVAFSSTLSTNNYIAVLFHTEQFMTNGSTGSKGYQVKWIKGYSPSNGLQLVKRATRNATPVVLAMDATVPYDGNSHKIRITDDGTGHIDVFFDDLGTPRLSYDDSASYTADAQTWAAVELGSATNGTSWFQNVTAYDSVESDPNNLPPLVVTDLAATATDWNRISLQWTAPADRPSNGKASRYDIRYSTNPILNNDSDATWNAATPLTGLPSPATPGTVQTFAVTGLTGQTTYYFALKSSDSPGLVSAISNIVSATTPSQDTTSPAAVSDLAASTVKPLYLVLNWTAPGDDGSTGQAAAYDLRYSTNPIDDTDFTAATPLTGLGTPKIGGSAETFTVNNLTPSTTYYFAVKTRDEVPNWSAISNVLQVTTPVEDLQPPTTITDLHVAALKSTQATLAWTAPTDVGPSGVAGYDIRYSTSSIDDTNWASATAVSSEPTPAAPGTQQTFTVTGLTPNTTWYFAMKSMDAYSPANVSALSNVASGATPPPPQPVTVHNPWLVNDRVANTHDINTMGATYVNAYTPDGVVLPTTDEQKAINLYNNQKRRLYHWADEPPRVGFAIEDPTYLQNVYGWCLCGRHAANGCTIAHAAGLAERGVSVPGHDMFEMFFDGGWHVLDTMTTMYVYTKDNPPHIANLAEISADHSIMLDAVADGRACPGYLLCGDTPQWFVTAADNWGISGIGVQPTTWSANMDLRIGESFNRTWESWTNEHPTPKTDSDTIAGNDPPYHHEAKNDWMDTVNFPYWEPYGFNAAQNAALGIGHPVSYRRWANGSYVLAPDFGTPAYQSAIDSAVTSGIATRNDDGLSPDLHAAAAGTMATAVFQVHVPFYITDATISGDFYRHDSGDSVKVAVSNVNDSSSFTQLWASSTDGTTHVDNLSLRSKVFNTWTFWVRIQITSNGSKNDAGVSNLVINTTFVHNKGAMAYLDKGVNHLTLTFDNPAELQASGNLLHVYYKWKEYDGTDWTVDRHYEGYFAASPGTFTITTAGNKVPRTEYALMEVVPPVSDLTAPGQITDLAPGTPTATKVPLTWTAVADDGTDPVSGAAITYDLRYSTNPINDQNAFLAATRVVGLPAPANCGTSESFTVTGLGGGTTYYFAVEAVDKGNNHSALSNIASVTTSTAPSITTLAVTPGTIGSNKVSLAWSAIDDGDGGNLASHDLRYSTVQITDDASFSTATPVAGLPVPQASGGNESFTVKGLSGGTTYWFAIKGVTRVGTASPLSNVVSATTLEADTVPPQWVGNLMGKPSKTGGGVDLTWTAPADYGANNSGPFPCCSYDLRYSTSPILYDDGDATWNAATSVTALPAPKAPGSAESVTVAGLTTGTTYYFALKVSDDSNNVSQVSNCAAARPSRLGEKTLQVGLSGYAGCVDSYYCVSNSVNYGAFERMVVCGYGPGNYQRPILKFDVSGIPADTAVTSATVSLYAYQGPGGTLGTTGFYGLYPVTTDWTDKQVTWTLAKTSTNWTTPGGDFLADADAVSPKQSSAGLPVNNVWYNWDVTGRVQSWMSGTTTNYGWILKCTDETLSNQDYFYSSDTANSTLRPKLIISDLKPRKVGDIDGDDSVNVGDLLLLVTSWAKTPDMRGFEPRADLNGDGYVNVGDLQALIAHWGM